MNVGGLRKMCWDSPVWVPSINQGLDLFFPKPLYGDGVGH